MIPDLVLIFQWWLFVAFLGIIFLPLAKLILPRFFDDGYIFSKIIGCVVVTYVIFLVGTLHLLSFSRINIFAVVITFIAINLYIYSRNRFELKLKLYLLEEAIFLLMFTLWAFLRGMNPEIYGIEKYMDFAFLNSILRTDYFPAKDPWLTPFSINYYYFGHIIAAVLTKLSGISSYISYNLVVATLFAMSFTATFSLVINLILSVIQSGRIEKIKIVVAGIFSAFVLTLAGNLHPIYSFFKSYQGSDAAPPFWTLVFSPQAFPNAYWYPNASRFITNTIHEFPSYAFILSDLHGHLSATPISILTLGVLVSYFMGRFNKIDSKTPFLFFTFLISILYMTNTLDAFLFVFIFLIVSLFFSLSKLDKLETSLSFLKKISLLGLLSMLFSLPFGLFFKPFTSGVGILCAPKFLTDMERVGPLLFEVNHCQRSPVWQLGILYGFFYIILVPYLFLIFKKRPVSKVDLLILFLYFTSTLFIVVPELIYIKDIYPGHYRANTMFKLSYQAFIILSICSGFIFFRVVQLVHELKLRLFQKTFAFLLFVIFVLTSLIVFIYPFLAIPSAYGGLKKYNGLDGIKYLKEKRSSDYQAINWINQNIKGQPIILEAQGDSYTDYARVSSNTGLPTVLGWTVHEWLWRGTYDVPSARFDDIKNIYETQDSKLAKLLIKKYNISLIYVGGLEREKYKVSEDKFLSLSKIIYSKRDVVIYKLN